MGGRGHRGAMGHRAKSPLMLRYPAQCPSSHPAQNGDDSGAAKEVRTRARATTKVFIGVGVLGVRVDRDSLVGS